MDITLLLSILGPIIVSESITYFKVIPELKSKIITLQEKTQNLETEYKTNLAATTELSKTLIKMNEQFDNLDKSFNEQKKENKELNKDMQKTLELNTLAIGKLDVTLNNLEKIINNR
jgi:septal ring factor EnvC (AmiA/AmiB activator)